MISAKRIAIFLILTTSFLTIVGQNCYEYRPNTFPDSLAVIKNGVMMISSTISFSENVIDPKNIIDSKDSNCNTNDSVWIFQSNNSIDSSKVTRVHCNEESTYNYKGNRIIETKIYYSNSNSMIMCICERVHFLNKDKQIYLTKNKLLIGRFYEGEGYSSIRYLYQNGLLTKARVYYKTRWKEYLHSTLKFKYGLVPN